MEIKVFEKAAGDYIASEASLHQYCHEQGQVPSRVAGVLSSMPREELYVVHDGGPVGAIFLVHAMDMHHGPVTKFAACWVSKYAPKGAKTMLLKAAFERCLFTKYQRSYHLDSDRQVIITKEVPNGFH